MSDIGKPQSEAGADDARDAARYRFLRAASPSDVEGYWWGYAQDTNSDLSLLDAVIDADMGKSNATNSEA